MKTLTKTADDLIRSFELKPHPEGGYYKEYYRSAEKVEWQGKTLTAGTAIYFLLRAGDKSWGHRIPQDEIWHFYEGDPLELVFFSETALKLNRVILSEDNRSCTVPGGFWQAALPLGKYSLIGCTVSPGFEFSLFELLSAFPDKKKIFHQAMPDFSRFD